MFIALALLVGTTGPSVPGEQIAPAAFAAPVLTSGQLNDLRGGYGLHRLGSRQSIIDANIVSTFQLQAETNRITFDNWFANEGSVLIINNILVAGRQ